MQMRIDDLLLTATIRGCDLEVAPDYTARPMRKGPPTAVLRRYLLVGVCLLPRSVVLRLKYAKSASPDNTGKWEINHTPGHLDFAYNTSTEEDIMAQRTGVVWWWSRGGYQISLCGPQDGLTLPGWCL